MAILEKIKLKITIDGDEKRIAREHHVSQIILGSKIMDL